MLSSIAKSLPRALKGRSAGLSLRAFATSVSESLIATENKFSAHNYAPIPVVFSRAQGVHVWDPEGRQYIDFLSAYSAVNQGHCHPKIVKAAIDQMQKLTLSSRAFHNDVFPKFAEKITDFFGYESVLPMNTGVEAVETSVKIARKWGYKKKGIKNDEALIISCGGNFHGRSITVISMSDDPDAYTNYGPFLPGMMSVEFDNLKMLEETLDRVGHNVAAFLAEPIQGERGVYVPQDGYLKKAYELCKKHNVLFIADEVQTGVARTGKLLCSEWDEIKPDLTVLGKAISGGVYPVSAVLASRDVMDVITPGTHGSTYGGNPVGCAAAIAAMEVVEEEGLVERAAEFGDYLREKLSAIDNPLISQVRGRGLLNAVVIDESRGISAYDICIRMKEKGMLAKPTQGNIIRLAPPLVITKEQLDDCITIFEESVHELTQ